MLKHSPDLQLFETIGSLEILAVSTFSTPQPFCGADLHLLLHVGLLWEPCRRLAGSGSWWRHWYHVFSEHPENDPTKAIDPYTDTESTNCLIFPFFGVAIYLTVHFPFDSSSCVTFCSMDPLASGSEDMLRQSDGGGFDLPSAQGPQVELKGCFFVDRQLTCVERVFQASEEIPMWDDRCMATWPRSSKLCLRFFALTGRHHMAMAWRWKKGTCQAISFGRLCGPQLEAAVDLRICGPMGIDWGYLSLD